MFLRPIENTPPPLGKQPPLKRLNFRIWPKNQSQFRRRPFFFCFWRPPDFERKKPWNFGFRPKNQSQFRRRPFFFCGDHLLLGGKNLRISELSEKFRLKSFPRKAFRLKSFLSFPRNFVWNWFKKNENPGQGRLHFSHSFKIAPPFPNPGYAPNCNACFWLKATYSVIEGVSHLGYYQACTGSLHATIRCHTICTEN